MSAGTTVLNVGCAAPPDVGPAQKVLADCVAFVTPRVPEVVIGDPDTENSAGTVMATEVTVPPEPVRVIVPPNATTAPPVMPPAVLIVIEELAKFAFGMPVGRSATTKARKVGARAEP